MAQQERTAQSVDISREQIEQLGEDYQLLVLESLELSKKMKAVKQQLTNILREKATAPQGYEFINVSWTRWGQHQAIIDQVKQAKAKAVRTTLVLTQDHLDGNGRI